jgi:p-cumate 2,3-dioxygenase beta subunit
VSGADPTSLDAASREQLRSDVAAFLYDEAALLDEWKLEEWLELFEPGATYQVPATDRPHGNPDTDQMLIADSYEQIHARVTRLNSRNAHAENPRSRTRRLITNVRIAGLDDDGIDVTAAFLVYRI